MRLEFADRLRRLWGAFVLVLIIAVISVSCWTIVLEGQPIPRAPVIPARPRPPFSCVGFALNGRCPASMEGWLTCVQPWYPRLERLDCYRCIGGCWTHVVPGVAGRPEATITRYVEPTRTPTP